VLGSVQSSELRDFTFASLELVLPNVVMIVISGCIWHDVVDEFFVTRFKSRERCISLIADLDISRVEFVLSHFAASIGYFIGARFEILVIET
jgi:hypothetical protein